MPDMQTESEDVMVDESVVKRLAVQHGLVFDSPHPVGPYIENFANAIAAHQREIDAEICGQVFRIRESEGLKIGYNAIMQCAEAIRKG